MSEFPTPWRVSQDECDVLDANDSKVMYLIPYEGYELEIQLDELVNRVNAADAQKAEIKELVDALKEFTWAQYPVCTSINASGNGWRTWELDGTYKKAKALLSKYREPTKLQEEVQHSITPPSRADRCANVTDLMDALRRSCEAAKARRQEQQEDV